MRVGGKPNIVIVIMDCVRAQNLPIYGYDKPTAPRISELAADAIRFDNAVTVGEQTLVSTTALFTGMYPSTHQVRVTGDKLAPELHTLAAAMKRAGYVTYSINCNNPYISPLTDLHRGFDTYTCAVSPLRRLLVRTRGRRGNFARPGHPEDARAETDVEPAALATTRGANWRAALRDRARWELKRFVDTGAANAFAVARRILRDRDASQPVLIYLHLMETHGHYEPPWAHRGLFLPDCRRRKVWRINDHPLPLITGAVKMDALDFEIIEGLYNGSIHYTDMLFGRFFDWLRAKGQLDNTVVILSADHGEHLGDHGLLGHGQSVYDCVIRVPLLVWGPVVESRARGSALSEVVQNVDITASCLAWAGTRDDPIESQLEGVPLPLEPQREPPREYAIAESVRIFERPHAALLKEWDLFHRGAVAARSKTHKLIWNTVGQEEFYDLVDDPGETKNLIDAEAKEVSELRAVLEPVLPKFRRSHEAVLARLEQGGRIGIDAVVEQRLRDLGYLE